MIRHLLSLGAWQPGPAPSRPRAPATAALRAPPLGPPPSALPPPAPAAAPAPALFSVALALGACTGAPGDLASASPVPEPPLEPDAGTIVRLLFAVVGDTRPAIEDDTGAYPVDIISRIYQDIDALSPRPQFVVATGDYMFASIRGVQAQRQLDLYMQARARYHGPLFPALGNHECTGATSSNCGSGNVDGVTPNYEAFLRTMLAPIHASAPYYAVSFGAADRTWTAKIVVIAANAWSEAQRAWFEMTLTHQTTYTFVVRHEPASAPAAPGVRASEDVLAEHPYTLALVGHSHTYSRSVSRREVLVGNGGAPLTGKSYGFALLERRDDGAIAVDMIDWQSGARDPAFRFAVNADGSAALAR